MAAKTVALVGANGFVGKAFAKELLQQEFDLRILARNESIESASLQDFKSKGASLHAISYEDEDSLVKALQGVDVLVSTVGASALLSAQLPLIKAAKAVGVKLFFPSGYGSPFEGSSIPSSLIQSEKKVIKAAQEVGLPFAALNNGTFPDYCLIPPFGYNFAEKKVTIWGDGNANITWTTVHSVGDWLANVLKTVPISRLENRYLLIQGNVATANEVVKLWEQKHNDKLEVDYRPAKELDDRVNANAEDLFAVLLQDWTSGRGEIGGRDNEIYPGWKPDTIESVL
ncbi:Isoflavone reductase homolog [Rhizoctonia solani AG-1 IB]|uniref:Isoflavone reductase homolog n=1 Tax=Thanatephorus cucumeris (strain AG1-IB / isolate 7/3/14) TaxID=1108050 RepID=M5C7C1_THACB|nr:Isoflavone reductase homolog [Rhizoctonia solani AG-1 IB]